jgi:hypothetical protein
MQRQLTFFLAILLGLTLFLWAENGAVQPFQSCIAQETAGPIGDTDTAPEESAIVRDLARAEFTCTVRLIDAHSGFFIAFAALVIAGFAAVLTRITSQHATINRTIADAAIATNRAYLFIDIVAENFFFALNQIKAGGREQIEVEYRFVNDGKTPATIKRVEADFDIWDRIPDTIQYSSEITQSYIKRFIKADEVTETKQRVYDRIDPDLAGQILLGNRNVWFFGRVIYDDVFGNEWEHRFLWMFRGGGGAFFRPVAHEKHGKSS